MSIIQFSVQGKAYNATKTEIKARKFRFLIDEPENLGGEDDAPNPVEYLLAGYAGCLNVVAHIVAKEKNIRLDQFEVNIEGDINPSRLLGYPTNDRSGFQAIRVTIDIKTDAGEEENRLLLDAIKQRCPVNDNLVHPTPIEYFINQPVCNN